MTPGAGKALVAGVDSSTQSTKVIVCDAETGRVVRRSSAPHPEGTEVHPDAWEHALRTASAGGLLDGVAAISVAGQQHGMVVLDAAGAVIGLMRIDYGHPGNPGDVLRFNPDDPDGWHFDRTRRAGEFALYDEYNPRRTILFNADNSVWVGCLTFSTNGHTCIARAPAPALARALR